MCFCLYVNTKFGMRRQTGGAECEPDRRRSAGHGAICGQGKREQNGRRATGHGAESEQGKREQNGRRAAEYGAESGQAAGETGEVGGNVWG